MTRNTKGQFKREVKPFQYFILGVVSMYMIFSTVGATQAGNEARKLSLKPGESVIITAEIPVVTQTPSINQKAPEIKQDELKGVKAYVKAYGGKITSDLVTTIHSQCGSVHNTKTAVAIATAETQQGKKANYPAKKGLTKVNYWNYDRFNEYKSVTAVSKDVCNSIKTPGMIYNNLISENGTVNYQKAYYYVVGCSAEHTEKREEAVGIWRGNVSKAFNSMK